MHKLYLTGCLTLLIVTGCDRSSTPTSQEPVPAQATVKPAPARLVEQINPAVVLKVTPNPVDFCNDKKLSSVTVEWDVTAAAIPNFSIWVEAPAGGTQKIWMSSVEPVSSKMTGTWVRDGMKFSLANSKKVVLATATVTSLDCTAAPAAPAAPAAAG